MNMAHALTRVDVLSAPSIISGSSASASLLPPAMDEPEFVGCPTRNYGALGSKSRRT